MGRGAHRVAGLVVFLMAAGARAATASASLDGGRLRMELPPGFERVAPELFEGSAALVPTLEGGGGRSVLAVFRDGTGEDAATLVVGRVGRPLELGPTVRANAASAVASHFRAELSFEVVVDRAVLAGPPGPPRLEVRSETELEGSARVVRFAFVPAGEAYYVVAASYPQRREQEFSPRLRASVESLVLAEQPGRGRRPFLLRLAVFGVIGIAAVLALRMWRR